MARQSTQPRAPEHPGSAPSRVVLVTGAARGIGLAIARRLLADGHAVGVLDLDGAELSRAYDGAGEHVELIAGDVSDDAVAEQAVHQVLLRFGRLDGIVSNAGIMVRKPLRELSPGEFRRVLDVNLTAAFVLARAAEAALRRAKGAIVTIASTRALMSEPDTEAYAASKGGLVALTHALAVSLGPDVRVNAVSPGWIATEDEAQLRPVDHEQHPVGRVGKPQDVAELVAYLLDGSRSGFVTGASWVIDGGMTRTMIYAE